MVEYVKRQYLAFVFFISKYLESNVRLDFSKVSKSSSTSYDWVNLQISILLSKSTYLDQVAGLTNRNTCIGIQVLSCLFPHNDEILIFHLIKIRIGRSAFHIYFNYNQKSSQIYSYTHLPHLIVWTIYKLRIKTNINNHYWKEKI